MDTIEADSHMDFEEGSDDEFEDCDGQDDEDSFQQPEIKMTNKLLQTWSSELKSKQERTLIRTIITFFRQAVDQVSGNSDDGDVKPRNKISSEHFNAFMKLCFVDLTPALYQSLGLDPPTGDDNETKVQKPKAKKRKTSHEKPLYDPRKCANWKKMVGPIKSYLTSLLSVLNSMTSESMTCSILRHCLHLVPFISCFPHLVKRYLNKVTTLWSSELSEKIRILSFLFILRLMKRPEQKFLKCDKKGKKQVEDGNESGSVNQLDAILRKMYLSFVKNCRLTNVETWPFINFMKQSLVELYSLDHAICYKQTFVFLRQTAITLRNSMSNNTVDGLKTVYNWAFVHSLSLWTQLLTTLHPSPVLKPLVYPLVQVIMGTIQLSPLPQYIPVKFHLIRSLIQLSKETDIFIPIAHLIAEQLDFVDYSSSGGKSKSKKKLNEDEKKKNIDLMSVIKVSKGDAVDAAYREEVVKTIFTLMLEYLSSQSHRISFPELTFVASLKLKTFLKEKCKNAGDSKLIKQLVDKIEESNVFITKRRKTVDFKFNDLEAVSKWENEIKQESSEICPINVFYVKWKSIRETNEKNEIQERKRQIQLKKENKEKKNSLKDNVLSDEDDVEGEDNAEEGMNGIGDESEDGHDDGDDAELIYDDDDDDDDGSD